MNAYELADGGDIIAEKNSTLDNQVRGYISDMADMLRQQADRIAELEKGGEVAGRFYWESVVDGHVMAVPSEGTPHYNKDDFPLYTAPQTKPLSDEEIEILWEKHCPFDLTAGIDFARAIEERHGIK